MRRRSMAMAGSRRSAVFAKFLSVFEARCAAGRRPRLRRCWRYMHRFPQHNDATLSRAAVVGKRGERSLCFPVNVHAVATARTSALAARMLARTLRARDLAHPAPIAPTAPLHASSLTFACVRRAQVREPGL